MGKIGHMVVVGQDIMVVVVGNMVGKDGQRLLLGKIGHMFACCGLVVEIQALNC